MAKIRATKVSELGSLLGKAGMVGFGKAVEVLDTLGRHVCKDMETKHKVSESFLTIP